MPDVKQQGFREKKVLTEEQIHLKVLFAEGVCDIRVCVKVCSNQQLREREESRTCPFERGTCSNTVRFHCGIPPSFPVITCRLMRLSNLSTPNLRQPEPGVTNCLMQLLRYLGRQKSNPSTDVKYFVIANINATPPSKTNKQTKKTLYSEPLLMQIHRCCCFMVVELQVYVCLRHPGHNAFYCNNIFGVLIKITNYFTQVCYTCECGHA